MSATTCWERGVISIEPLIECFEVLQRNHPVPEDCHNCAIGLEEDEVGFHVRADAPQLSSLLVSVDHPSQLRRVPCRRLDTLPGLPARIDLLKIDTEGAELDVVLSAEGLLDRVEAVLVEASAFSKSTGSLFQVGHFLETHGFLLSAMAVGGLPRPTDLDLLFERPPLH